MESIEDWWEKMELRACKYLPFFLFGVCFSIDLYYGEENDIMTSWVIDACSILIRLLWQHGTNASFHTSFFFIPTSRNKGGKAFTMLSLIEWLIWYRLLYFLFRGIAMLWLEEQLMTMIWKKFFTFWKMTQYSAVLCSFCANWETDDNKSLTKMAIFAAGRWCSLWLQKWGDRTRIF